MRSLTQPARLASVDALRGLTVAAMLLVNDPGDWGHVFAVLEHAAWHGCTPADVIFPLFLFIVGVSIALSAPARPGAIALRALRIVALGLALHAIAHWALGTREFRPMGVLQRIGVCYGVVAWLALRTSAATQWRLFALILFGHSAALLWGGPLTPSGNLSSRIDTALLGRFAYQFNAATGLGHDPEGLLSTLPALATTLLGVRGGAWLRNGATARIVLAGVAAGALGLLATAILPLNKQLWTASYVGLTGGVALLALALAHESIDRRGWPPLGRSLGINAIVAYAAAWLAVCVLDGFGWTAALYARAFGRMTPWTGPCVPSLAYALAFVAVFWIGAGAMQRRGVRIRI